MRRADLARIAAHAAGDDHLAVLGQRLADRVQAFLARAVEEPAGVDDDHVGAGVGVRDLIALGAERGQDALGIDQRLRAAEADDADLGGGFGRGFGRGRFHLILNG